MKYHDQLTPRERMAKVLYRIPIGSIKFELGLIKLIKWVEGDNPHWLHRGMDCPCMEEKIGN